MKMLALIILAAGTLVGMTDVASAQGWVRPGWTRTGSAVCPSNYVFDRGWCKPLHRGYEPRGYYGHAPEPRHYGGYGGGYGGGYRGGAVPARWNHLGSAVCPSNYDYHARVNACLPR